jgi:hypothetical protein
MGFSCDDSFTANLKCPVKVRFLNAKPIELGKGRAGPMLSDCNLALFLYDQAYPQSLLDIPSLVKQEFGAPPAIHCIPLVVGIGSTRELDLMKHEEVLNVLKAFNSKKVRLRTTPCESEAQFETLLKEMAAIYACEAFQALDDSSIQLGPVKKAQHGLTCQVQYLYSRYSLRKAVADRAVQIGVLGDYTAGYKDFLRILWDRGTPQNVYVGVNFAFCVRFPIFWFFADAFLGCLSHQ